MIKNERQYRITKAEADKFAAALRELEQAGGAQDVHPLLQQAQKDALRSQHEELQAQLDAYEALQEGRVDVLEVDSFEKLPLALIQARIAAGLTQKELAERLGLKEQQIQRYEATAYAKASLTRVQEVIDALGADVREEIILPKKKG